MTMISDLVPSEKVLGATIDLLMKDANELVTSGVAASGPEVEAVAGGGPRKASIPYLDPLATDEVNIGSDNITTEGQFGKLTGDEFTVLRHDLNYGWSATDLARMVTKYDAKLGIAGGIVQYWNGIYQKLATSSLKGVQAVNVNLTYGDGSKALDGALIVDATATAEMFMDQFDTLIVSPTTKAKLRKLSSYVTAGETNLQFDTFGGYKLITSMAFGNTTSVVCRSGALAFGEGTPAGMVPTEVERRANSGNGQGGDILHSRRSVVLHPQGFNWTGAVGANYAALETTANWSLEVPVEQVGFRFISHI